ncbi:Alpha helical Porin B [Corynebacterium faecale]|uniref:hypothetical protein n=1 Tax=Corynebacterium faecale TaxID=1758466 RepID=UPI0025B3B952|nr:hypothetical protein [Corynebacterium faecale]WJY91710.1 Alpha helical Porin B [Corynebacterium faecale]
MKISTRVAAIGATAALALTAFAAPASAISSDELSDRFEWIPCAAVEGILAGLDLPEDGMRNAGLADALAERGEGVITGQFPAVGDWNAQAAADFADQAQKCELVEPNTALENASSNLSSNFAGLSS